MHQVVDVDLTTAFDRFEQELKVYLWLIQAEVPETTITAMVSELKENIRMKNPVSAFIKTA